MNDELSEEKAKKYRRIRIAIQITVITAVIALIIYLTVILYPIVQRIGSDEEYRQYVTEKVESYRGFSFWIVVLAQIMQTVLAVIPAGPIVMVSGMIFSPGMAVFACVLGQTIGSVIAYLLVKLLGYRFVALFFDPNKIKESKMLKNEEQTKVLMFGYLCIPALPKDITAFIAPFTKIKILDFAIITFIARIPMTVVTVLIGSSISSGAYTLAIILACCSGLLALFCFVFNKQIIAVLEKIKIKNIFKKKEEKEDER